MLLAISRFTPVLNAHVYAIRRSPSTIGPVVVLLTTPPASTPARLASMNARHAGLMIASPATGPGIGLRQAVASASPALTGNVPVIAGEVTCVVSYASVGAITDRCRSGCRIAGCGYW